MKKKKILTSLMILLISASLFAEPYTYEDLISIMNVNNIELLTQDEVIKTATLDVKDAKGNYSPSIDLTLSGTYMVNPLIDRITVSTDDILGSLGQQMGIPNNYVTLYDGMENTLYMAQLSITQPIFTWGKVTNAVKLYEKILELRQLEKEDKQKSLSVELEGYLGGIYYASEILNLLTLASEDADQLISIAKSGYENGVMLLEEYNSAQLSKSELDMAKTEVEVQISTLKDNLGKTLGKKISSEEYVYQPDEEHYYEVSKMDRSDLRSRAVSNANSSIQMASMAIDAAELGEKIAKGSFYGKPDLALQVSLGYGGSRFPFIETNWNRKDDYSLNITVGMQTTLWDGGKILNDVKRAESQVSSSELTLESAKTQLSMALEENFRTMDLAISRTEYYQTKSDVLSDELDTLKAQLESGYVGDSDILQKQIEIYQNKISLLQEKANLMQGALAVEYIAGLR